MAQSARSVRTPHLEIAYEERGEAGTLPVVLLHGFPDDARTWDAVAGALAGEGYRTLAPYLRGFGATRFLDERAPRSGQLAALGQDVVEFVDALGLDRFTLVGHDWGARAAYIAAALLPGRVRGLVALAVGYGTNDPRQELSFEQARAYWYQWYFGLDRGREVLEEDRRGFCRYLWETWSPGWEFDEGEYEMTAASFDNPDFVEVAIHSYRHRWGAAPGDPRYDDLEARLAGPPDISVPTTVLMGADDGATLPETSAGKEKRFTAAYDRRVLPGVGHFVQRERPEAVVEAVLERAKRS